MGQLISPVLGCSTDTAKGRRLRKRGQSLPILYVIENTAPQNPQVTRTQKYFFFIFFSTLRLSHLTHLTQLVNLLPQQLSAKNLKGVQRRMHFAHAAHLSSFSSSPFRFLIISSPSPHPHTRTNIRSLAPLSVTLHLFFLTHTTMVSSTSTEPTSGIKSPDTRPQLVHIPSMPSVRSTSSPTPSTASTSSALPETPVQEVIFRHGRVEDAPLMSEMQFSNYKHHYSKIVAKEFLDNLDYDEMARFHAKNMTRKNRFCLFVS